MSHTSKPLRVRFAPSPTGLVHIGNLRGALVAYLLAKQSGGSFILRLEDTDRERFVPEAAQFLVDSLTWLGLEWDEGYRRDGLFGPYVQSERLNVYRQYANQLIAEDKAYWDYTTPEELDALRTAAQKAGTAFRFTRDMARSQPVGDEAGVVRFATPEGPSVAWDDLVWGPQSWERHILDDFVCLKSDGFPTYNFAVVIDDHLMEIDVVTRGQEFLPTTPKNLLVYAAFGWVPPQFAHLPWIMGPDGKTKLSKRHGAKSALEYRDLGYLADAVFNFMASMGWNDGTEQELFTRAEIIKKFSLDRVQKSNAIFDPERLDWMNGLYIRNLFKSRPGLLLDACEPFWPDSAKAYDQGYKQAVLALDYERIKYLSQLTNSTKYFFSTPDVSWDGFKVPRDEALRYVSEVREAVEDMADFHDTTQLEYLLREEIMPRLELEKPGPLFMTIRYAVTGQAATPGLFELLAVIGRPEVAKRLANAEQVLSD